MSEDGEASLASSATLFASLSPVPKASTSVNASNIFLNARVHASTIIEFVSSRVQTTSAVYIFDLAEQVGFGTLTKEWAKNDTETAPVIDMQTRAGAGLSLVGRLSQGTSQDTVNGGILTAYASLSGLSMMAPALAQLPPASASSRLVIHVPVVIPVGDNFSMAPSSASLSSVLAILPKDVVILSSGTPQEAVDFAQIAYKLTSSHVIHLFDQHSTAREIGIGISPLVLTDAGDGNPATVISNAGYASFGYSGDSQAQTVLVLLNGPLALYAKAFAAKTPGFGVVTVSVLRPWDEATLRGILPDSTKTIHVLDEVLNASVQGPLYIDVLSTVLDPQSNFLTVRPLRITPTKVLAFFNQKDMFLQVLYSLLPVLPDPIPSVLPEAAKKLALFSTPKSPLSTLPNVIEDAFVFNKGVSSRLLVDHDVFSKTGGITLSRLILAPKTVDDIIPVPLLLPLDTSAVGIVDFLGILDHTILTSHSLIPYAKPHSIVLVITPWSPAELLSNMSHDDVSNIRENEIALYTVDAKKVASELVGSDSPLNDAIQNFVAHLVFLRLYLGSAAKEESVLKVARTVWAGISEGTDLVKVNSHTWDALVKIEIPNEVVPASGDLSLSKRTFDFNAIVVETPADTVVNGAHIGSWHDAAKHLLFPSVYAPDNAASNEQFPQIPSLRPEVPDRTYLVTCTVNRRLTGKEYDRNVFHLEFDTSGTGLKYEIGEALGVHGWNDEEDVLQFCKWYGVDPNRLVTIPVPSSDGKMHTRTVFQALQQQVDLFGRPPKSFYSDLAAYATNSVDKHALLFIASPEGAATFKKLSEKDTVNFAEVLQMYPSAKPGIETLCELIGDIKPRHYSIASAQSVVGDRVDLLVVTVDWVTPSGSPKFGQCTRYLVGLKVGQKVTVSIKPSVMKLPPDNKQPLIMAGLGTGAAPFRAFLQHRAMLREKGEEVGPVYYYFGSRYQSQEYLYGEEIETFIEDGVISRAGLAFSRDGPKKVYIQHKMLEDSKELATMLREGAGVFYLCGPTWPVPDVYEALVNALVKFCGMDAQSAGEYLEGLKEEERYVLEVY